MELFKLRQNDQKKSKVKVYDFGNNVNNFEYRDSVSASIISDHVNVNTIKTMNGLNSNSDIQTKANVVVIGGTNLDLVVNIKEGGFKVSFFIFLFFNKSF